MLEVYSTCLKTGLKCGRVFQLVRNTTHNSLQAYVSLRCYTAPTYTSNLAAFTTVDRITVTLCILGFNSSFKSIIMKSSSSDFYSYCTIRADTASNISEFLMWYIFINKLIYSFNLGKHTTSKKNNI